MSEPKRRRKKTTVRIEAIKSKLCELWGRILIKPMPTEEIFKELGYDYGKVKDRETIYRYNSYCQEEAEAEWDKFSIVEGDKEIVYKTWLEHCYLNKIPYIIFDSGFARSPKTYQEWQKILERTCIKGIFGVRTSMERMLAKDMEIRTIPLKELLLEYDEFIKLLPENIEDSIDEE